MDRLISSNSSPGFRHFSTSNTALDLARSGPSMSSPNGPLTTDRPNYLEQTLPQASRDLHDRSVLEGASTYTDPDSGYTVFCRKAHLDRGKCCGSGCRHCPYGWENVPAHRKPRPTKMSDYYSEAKATVPPVADVEDIAKCSTDVAPEAPATTESAPVAGEGRPVKKSRVYTRTGDKGKSSLYTGERRPKTDVVFETLGTVDELMSCIGVAKEYLRLQQQATPGCSEETNTTDTKDSITTSQVNQIVSVEALEHIQQLLMDVATIVATPVGGEKVLNRERAREKLSMYNPDEWIKDLERQIDLADSYLPPITVFILPGGGLASAHLHVARSTCRRAERCMIWVQQEYGDDYDPLLTSACKFVNRLSDFLFVAARAVALHADIHRSTPNGGK